MGKVVAFFLSNDALGIGLIAVAESGFRQSSEGWTEVRTGGLTSRSPETGSLDSGL